MHNVDVLIISRNNYITQQIRSTLDLAKIQIFGEKYQITSYYIKKISELFEAIRIKNHDVIVVEISSDDLKNENFSKEIDKLIAFFSSYTGSVIFIGPRDPNTIVKVMSNSFISSYIIEDEFNAKTFPKFLTNKHINKQQMLAEERQIDKLVEIIHFHEQMFDDLVKRALNVEVQPKETTSKGNLGYEEGKNYPVWYLDIRIMQDKRTEKLYLKYELERLTHLIHGFIDDILHKFVYIKFYTDDNRIVLGFKNNDALKCALEIIIKLTQINMSSTKNYSEFLLKIGISRGRMTYYEDFNKLKKNVNLKHLEMLLNSTRIVNSIILDKNVYTALPENHKKYFSYEEKYGEHPHYIFKVEFG